MRVLVTGASGFVGGHVVEAFLAGGHDVTSFVRPSSRTERLSRTRIVYGDVTGEASCLDACRGQDIIVHTVGLVGGYAGWRSFEEIGVRGTGHMLQAARAAGVKRFVHISSGAVYATPANGEPVNESSPLVKRPRGWNHYVRQKLGAEALVWRWHGEGGVEVTVIRPSVVLGERDRHTSPRIVRFLKSPLAGLIGGGGNHIPCVDVQELAQLVVRASVSETAAGKTYNVSGRRPITQAELFRLHAEAAGLPFRGRRNPAAVAERLSALVEMGSHLIRRKTEPTLTRFALSIATADCLVDCSRASEELEWRGDASYASAVTRAVAGNGVQ